MATTLDAQPIANPNRSKFILGGLLLLVAVVYLIVSSTIAGAQYFFTVDELMTRTDDVVGSPLRVSGAVIGETIDYDPDTLTLKFTVAHMPGDQALLDEEGGLAEALYTAVNDPDRTRMEVVYVGVKPDLLRHEAQAIMAGTMGEDGVFYADELLLKCPTRYEEAAPDQVSDN
ncbi:MAG: cytochrome c maturation protein CcmE [Chloroflexi bacterium]|nr:MAG: cytochrome c maturation protein CcmE [Chloroflexota bacterium]MBL1194181.1 cytochrome c maturation protein CcmE [Chloroflexota bacterium]NOH11473.1 cytochrome c maturation protein CcmE [Chloroflexota bacterium]